VQLNCHLYGLNCLNLKAFVSTETLEKLIAKAANTGFNGPPKIYKTLAAIAIPSILYAKPPMKVDMACLCLLHNVDIGG